MWVRPPAPRVSLAFPGAPLRLNCLSSFRVASGVESVSRHPCQRKMRSLLLFVGSKALPVLQAEAK